MSKGLGVGRRAERAAGPRKPRGRKPKQEKSVHVVKKEITTLLKPPASAG